MFKTNIGKPERAVRLAIGVAALYLGYTYQSYWGFLGLIPLVTAAMGWCPLYVPFGFSTCPKKH